MDRKLLDILACPACKSGLKYLKEEQELICLPCRLAYTVRDDIPIMLVDEARKLTSDEADELR
ncbi:MAG: Trm112 family protein [Cycloclasticus sp.]|nr:Trm112 family protein [Cycloclasticus sp.]